jgi:hypothetical protein
MVKAWVVGWDSWEKQNREGGGGGKNCNFARVYHIPFSRLFILSFGP